MPKIVDHDLRRSKIVAATCEVIAEEGLEAATMRRIAERAGSTTGLVTHYFDSKRAVLIAALRSVHEAAAARMLATVETAPPRRALRAVVEEALPLDQRRLVEWRVWLAFWGQAAVDAELKTEQRLRYAEWAQLLEHLLGADQRADVDGLIALIDGIGTRASLSPDEFPPERQRAIVDRYLRRAVGGVSRLSP